MRERTFFVPLSEMSLFAGRRVSVEQLHLIFNDAAVQKSVRASRLLVYLGDASDERKRDDSLRDAAGFVTALTPTTPAMVLDRLVEMDETGIEVELVGVYVSIELINSGAGADATALLDAGLALSVVFDFTLDDSGMVDRLQLDKVRLILPFSSSVREEYT